MSKKIKIIITAVLLGALLASCGVSQEKIDEAGQSVETMKTAREKAEATFLDITDSSRERELEILGKEADGLIATDINKLNNKKIDSFISQVKDLTVSYQSMNEEFAAILETETQEREERANHTFYDVYLVNNSGKDFTVVNFIDSNTMTTYKLLDDGAVLKNGYTLMGVRMDINKTSDKWSFNCEEANGTEYFFICEGLAGRDLDGATFTLKINSETGEEIAAVSK
jgi:outer membrane murein-binding lipoprotein Lpp